MSTITALDNTPDLQALLVHGKPADADARKMLMGVNLEMANDQATELTFLFDDPGLKLLRQQYFDLDVPVRYHGLKLYVAVIETGEGAGLGGLAIRCRPVTIKRLKALRGKKVLKQVSPSTFVRSECKEAKVPDPVAQKSPRRKRVARDTDARGTTYDPGSEPSAWTTMRRLADERGYLLYEVGGTVYFGAPTWLVRQRPATIVDWYPEGSKEPMTIPEIRDSSDSRDIEVDVELPIRRAGGVLPGTALRLTNFPKYSGSYMINNVSYPLTGDGVVTISASTIRNPEPQRSTSGSTPSTDPADYPHTTSAVKQYAQSMLASYGWGPDQFSPLEQLWEHESGWNYRAVNPSSGATGIPQALPGSKMASEGSDWRTNPETQIRWGLGYIKGRYGSPANAWAHFQSKNWY